MSGFFFLIMRFTDSFPDIIDCRFDYLERCESLTSLKAEVLEHWCEATDVLPPDAPEIIDREVNHWIDDAVLRHDVPWFSDGIKEELTRDGIPVTKADVLDDYFDSHRWLVREALIDRTPEKAALLAADGILFDDGMTGNLAAYTQKEIMASWWRLHLI